MKPNDTLNYYRPDEVAECFDVSEDLYHALWNSMADAKPLGEIIDIEDSCPQDAIGIHTVTSFWDKFTLEQQKELNDVVL
jgi:hypothetical protein